MGALIDALGPRVYLDTNIVIYSVEGITPYGDILGQLLDAIDDGAIEAVTSELTLAEASVKPLAIGRPDLVTAYEQLVSSTGGRIVVPITRGVLRDAAEIRAASGLKLPDAIHLASARLSGCSTFLTNDTLVRATASPVVIQLRTLLG